VLHRHQGGEGTTGRRAIFDDHDNSCIGDNDNSDRNHDQHQHQHEQRSRNFAGNYFADGGTPGYADTHASIPAIVIHVMTEKKVLTEKIKMISKKVPI
jgi:hypothetical protein